MTDELKEKLKKAIAENADPIEPEKQSLPRSIFIIPGAVFAIILLGTYFLNPYSIEDSGPYGKIESP